MAFLCRNLLKPNQTLFAHKVLKGNISSYSSGQASLPIVETLNKESDASKPWLMLPFGKGYSRFYDIGSDGGKSGFVVTGIPERILCSSDDLLVCSKSGKKQNLLIHSPFDKESIQVSSSIRFPYIEDGTLCLPEVNLTRRMVRSFVFRQEKNIRSYGNKLIAIVQDGLVRRLAYCEIDQPDSEWIVVHGSCPSGDQIVYSNKHSKAYIFSGDGCIEGYDFESTCSKPIVKGDEFMYKQHFRPHKFRGFEKLLRKQCNSKKYLVADDSTGDLLMVIKHYANHVDDGHVVFDVEDENSFPYKTMGFDVYKLKMEERSVEYVDCIGDRVIFLGLNQSFVLPTNGFPGLKRNSVYFLDDFPEKIYDFNCSYGGHDSGIYDLEGKSVARLLPLEKLEKIYQPMFWIEPSMHLSAGQSGKKYSCGSLDQPDQPVNGLKELV